MSSPTYAECANSWSLWQEYVDPNATMTETEFDAMTIEDRMSMMVECFGPEQPDED
jgi:hypothetical protein